MAVVGEKEGIDANQMTNLIESSKSLKHKQSMGEVLPVLIVQQPSLGVMTFSEPEEEMNGSEQGQNAQNLPRPLALE